MRASKLANYLRGMAVAVLALIPMDYSIAAKTTALPSYQLKSAYALRAAYLYHFFRFVTWPDNIVFNNNQVVLCVLSSDKEDLRQLSLIDNKKTGKMTLRILHLADKKAALSNNCHMLYISEQLQRESGLDITQIDKSTLTITEGDQPPGIINLFFSDRRLLFEIDLLKAKQQGIDISSKLMRLSRRRR